MDGELVWLKLYPSAARKGWTSKLPLDVYGAWVKLLQMMKEYGVTGNATVTDVTDLLRGVNVPETYLQTILAAAGDNIVVSEGILTIANWSEYQGRPDLTNNAERQKRWRERHKRNASNVTHNESNIEESRVEEIRIEENRAQAAPASSPAAPSDPAPAKKRRKKREKAPPKPRLPNPYWDAVCDVFRMHAATEGDGKRIGALARDYKAKCLAVGKDASEIGVREAFARANWSEGMATVDGVLKQWDQLVPPKPKPASSGATIQPKAPQEATHA